MPDEVEDYLRQRRLSRQAAANDDGGWLSGASDYVFGKPRGLSSLITGEDDSEPGLFERVSKGIRENPYLGKRFGWVEGLEKANQASEDAWAPYIGRTGAKILNAPSRLQTFNADMMAGSPMDVASTLAYPVKEAALGVKALGKAAPYVAKGVGYAGRAADALQSTMMGGQAIGDVKKGNYGQAALNAGGAILSGYGAADYPLPLPKPGNKINLDEAFEANRVPAFLRNDPKFANRPVTKTAAETTSQFPEGKVVVIKGDVKGKGGDVTNPPLGEVATRPVRSKFKSDEAYESALSKYKATQAGIAETVRTSQEPLRFSRPVTGPEVITDPARLLPEKSGLPAAPPSEVRASVTHPNDVWTNRNNGRTVGTGGDADRAIADLTAAGEEVNARNLERYLQIDEYRRGIQNRADAAGKPGGYEVTVSSDMVTPATAAPNYPPEIAPETRAAVDAAGERVNAGQTTPDTLASRPTERGSLDDGGSVADDVAQAVDEPVAQTVGDGEVTSRIDARTEAPYRYGENPRLDGQMKSKVQRVLKNADKELAEVADPAERRTRLIEILGKELTLNELGAAFEGKILNSGIVRDASTARIGLGLEESANVPRVPEQDVTPNIGPANNTPPPGFGGRRGTLETAPPTGVEGIVSGPPTTPPQVSGLRQVMAEPGLASRPVMRTPEDVLEALRSRGVTEPTPEMVQKIMSDPALLDKIVPGTSEFVPDVSKGFTPTNRPVESRADRMIPERVPVQTDADRIMSPEAATAAIERARKAVPRDIFTNNQWERAQAVARELGDDRLASALGRAGAHIDATHEGLAKRTAKDLGMSMETEISRMGPAGEQAKLLAQQVDAKATKRGISYIQSVSDDVARVDNKTWEKIVDYLEGNNKAPSAEVKALGDRVAEVFRTMGKDQVERGLLPKGATTEYWPRRWDGVSDKTITTEMRKQGKSADEINRALDAVRQRRELKTSAEYSRSGNDVPGYRKDKRVFFEHARDVSKRIEQVDHFGLKDVADPESPISKLIAGTTNPERAKDLMTRIIRGGPEGTELGRAWAHRARTWATGSMMQLSMLPNIAGGTLSTLARGEMKQGAKALFDIFNNNHPATKFMRDANRINEFSAGFAEGMGSNFFNKWYGINWSQNLNNRYAGATGYGTAKSMFQQLKANPGDKSTAVLLKDLVLEDIPSLLKQDSLTEEQLKTAVTRFVDITQGVTSNRKLPYAWVQSGWAQIPQIFMRVNFQVSKAMKDGVAQRPISTLAKLGTLGMALGEAVNLGKEVPKTAAQVGTNKLEQALGVTDENKDFGETYKENVGYGEEGIDAARFYQTRKWLSGLPGVGDKAEKNPALVWAMNNIDTSFAAGLPLNILSALSSGVGKNSQDPGGDTLNNMFMAVDEGGKILKEGWGALDEGATAAIEQRAPDPRDLFRFAVRRAPIPGGFGSGIVREIDTRKQASRPVHDRSSIYLHPENFR